MGAVVNFVSSRWRYLLSDAWCEARARPIQNSLSEELGTARHQGIRKEQERCKALRKAAA